MRNDTAQDPEELLPYLSKKFMESAHTGTNPDGKK
jgi:hypothetical protein